MQGICERATRTAVAAGIFAVLCAVCATGLAASARADECPNEAFRIEQGARGLAACRAYELVSPPYKAGFEFRVRGFASDGSRIFAQSLGAFAGAEGGYEGGAFGTTYELARQSSGWSAKPVSPPVSQFPGQFFLTGEPDKGISLWDLHTPQQSLNAHNLYTRSALGALVNVGPLWPAGATAGPPSNAFSELGATRVVGTTEDLSHIVFITPPGFSHEGKRLLFPGDETLNGTTLYQYFGTSNTAPSLVGVSGGAGSTALISPCGTTFGGPGSEFNAISRDGQTLLFTPTPGECSGENETGELVNGTGPTVAEIYARIASASTVAVSEPSLNVPGRICTGECAEDQNEENGHLRGAATFQGASDDGTRVYFTTSQPLVDADTDSSPDLYEAVIDGGAVTALNRVSVPVSSEAAEVRGVSRVSADGSTVYFVASGVLANNAGAAVDPETGTPLHALPGAANLYVYREGKVTFVGALSEEDGSDWAASDERPVQTTPDGRYLLIASRAQLTLGDESSAAAPQLFEYDANAQQLTRISVGQEGYANNGNITSFPNLTAEETYQRVLLRGVEEVHSFEFDRVARDGAKNMSDDGSAVVFNSAARLSPSAFSAAAGCTTVYEYRSSGSIANGTVHLASGGRDVQRNVEDCGAQFDAMDASGNDVLFDTADPLVSGDTDTQRDVYDARIDGGFAPTPGAGSCEQDACRGALAPQPNLASPGSLTQPAGQNVVPPRQPAPDARTKILSSSATANGLTVRLQVFEGGVVSIGGAGVKALSRRVAGAGSITVRASLTAPARNKLRHRHKLKIVAHVKFKGVSGATASTTTTTTARRAR